MAGFFFFGFSISHDMRILQNVWIPKNFYINLGTVFTSRDIRVRQHLGSNIPLEPLEATWLKSGRSYWPNIHLITPHHVAENSIQSWIIYQPEPRQLCLSPRSYLHSAYSISGPFVKFKTSKNHILMCMVATSNFTLIMTI